MANGLTLKTTSECLFKIFLQMFAASHLSVSRETDSFSPRPRARTVVPSSSGKLKVWPFAPSKNFEALILLKAFL